MDFFCGTVFLSNLGGYLMAQIKKVTVSFSEKTLEYVDSKAEEIGVTRSAMLAFMAEMYRKQDEATDMISQLQGVLEKEEK